MGFQARHVASHFSSFLAHIVNPTRLGLLQILFGFTVIMPKTPQLENPSTQLKLRSMAPSFVFEPASDEEVDNSDSEEEQQQSDQKPESGNDDGEEEEEQQ